MKQSLRRFLFGSSAGNSRVMNIALLLFRIHIGLSIAIHAGWPKMNTISAPGWFTDQVAGLGFTFPSPGFWAAMASWGEMVGGLCIALGLLTRFSALQLAFQFFVISFLWYDSPEPVTGMYFQNTLFMGFVLLAFSGAGKYSLDHLIMHRKPYLNSKLVKTTAIATVLLLLGMSGNAQTITTQDLQPAAGKWKGTLTYLDYSSNKSETINANVLVEVKGSGKYYISFSYTDEPKYNGKEKFVIKENGTMVNNKKVIEKTTLPDGSVRIVLESRGKDGNDHKMATFREILLIAANSFSITKMVKFDEGGEYFERNRYAFAR